MTTNSLQSLYTTSLACHQILNQLHTPHLTMEEFVSSSCFKPYNESLYHRCTPNLTMRVCIILILHTLQWESLYHRCTPNLTMRVCIIISTLYNESLYHPHTPHLTMREFVSSLYSKPYNESLYHHIYTLQWEFVSSYPHLTMKVCIILILHTLQ